MVTHTLSVIIPTINEDTTLGRLLESLAQQQALAIDVVVADGGSQDDTIHICHEFQSRSQLKLTVVETPPGRARQMNAGANKALSDTLLFLHADTAIEDPGVLSQGLYHFLDCAGQSRHGRIAGHFKLRFSRDGGDNGQAYYFYESKTSLNRVDTINGDQGFLLTKQFFSELGGFDEDLGYMEDARLARSIFELGQWITLPGFLSTSARRFETEGLKQRQTLNAILCNFVAIGFWDFFQQAASAYRQQDKTQTLQLQPYLAIIHRLTIKKGLVQACKYWYATGRYVASNAWQLFFLMDCRKNFKQQRAPGSGPRPWLSYYDRWLHWIFELAPVSFLAGALTLIWFYGLLLSSLLKRSPLQADGKI